MTDKELLRQALEALKMSHELQNIGLIDFEEYKLTCDADIRIKLNAVIKAIESRLAHSDLTVNPWADLNDEEIKELIQKLKEKNR